VKVYIKKIKAELDEHRKELDQYRVRMKDENSTLREELERVIRKEIRHKDV